MNAPPPPKQDLWTRLISKFRDSRRRPTRHKKGFRRLKGKVACQAANADVLVALVCCRHESGLCLCSLEVRVPGYRSRSTGSIPGAATFAEK
jgi:hypothetical protein